MTYLIKAELVKEREEPFTERFVRPKHRVVNLDGVRVRVRVAKFTRVTYREDAVALTAKRHHLIVKDIGGSAYRRQEHKRTPHFTGAEIVDTPYYLLSTDFCYDLGYK